jgi:hypothetical protein
MGYGAKKSKQQKNISNIPTIKFNAKTTFASPAIENANANANANENLTQELATKRKMRMASNKQLLSSRNQTLG